MKTAILSLFGVYGVAVLGFILYYAEPLSSALANWR